MADFRNQDLTGSTLEYVDLTDSTLRMVRLDGALFRAVSLHDVVMRGVELVDADITGELRNVTVNGVDIAPLVDAELNRRHPGRELMRPDSPAGFVAAWDTIEQLWAETVEHARTFRPDQLHASVHGEWSFIETLRHLVFASESWVNRAIVGDPSPWHPLSLPWDEMRDTPGVPRDRRARPSLDEVLVLRRDRMATVRQVIDSLTDASLAADTVPVEGPGWPEPRSYPLIDCLHTLLNEEWEHRMYAERDLAALESSEG